MLIQKLRDSEEIHKVELMISRIKLQRKTLVVFRFQMKGKLNEGGGSKKIIKINDDRVES